MKQKIVQISKQLDGHRLDIALVNTKLGLSRRKIRRIIDVGGVYVNDHRVRVASRQVWKGDTIRLEYQEEQVRKLKKTDFVLRDQDVLFDDSHIIVINKPPGLPSQATRDQSILHVVPVVQRYYESKDARPGKLILVHRLDKETSGAIILAKDESTATFLTDQFRAKLVQKVYHAICFGRSKQAEFSFSCFLSAIQPKTGIVKSVRSGGKSSHTDFNVRAINDELQLTYMICKPKTGRSHQLRVHLDLNELPIVGDKKYGTDRPGSLPEQLATLAADHHLLHCGTMTFQYCPDKPAITVDAPLPPNMETFTQIAFGPSKTRHF